MTPDEIKAKSAEIAALYTAKANGGMLQYLLHPIDDIWEDESGTAGPSLSSDLSLWRVKPKPRRMWETFSRMDEREAKLAPSRVTHIEAEADQWREDGYKVTEWMEVLL